MGCCGSTNAEQMPDGMDPQELAKYLKEQQNKSNHCKVNIRLQSDDRQQKIINKLLLLGTGSSGKTTLFKALGSAHGAMIDVTEMDKTLQAIRQNIILGILILLQQSQELYDQDANSHSDCRIVVSDDLRNIIRIIVNNGNNQFIDVVDWDQMNCIGEACKKVWDLPQIQATFRKRGGRFLFADNLDYFFNNVEHIMAQGYIPTEEDCLKARIHTIGE